MVYDLPYRPAAGPVRSVQLCVPETADDSPQVCWHRGDILDGPATRSRRPPRIQIETADRIAWIDCHWVHVRDSTQGSRPVSDRNDSPCAKPIGQRNMANAE